MHAYATVFGNVLWPAWERVRRRSTVDLLTWLEGTQWYCPEELERLQLSKLKRLLVHAQTNVPYYRELFAKLDFDARGLRSTGELRLIPPLTREMVRERYDDLIDPAYRGRMLKKGTSGSTGTPLKFEYTRESEWWRQALRVRGYGWAGYRPGARTFQYWAQVSDRSGMKVKLDRALRREIFVDSMKQDEESRLRAVELLREHPPDVIVCYTQSCAQWARWILENELRTWGTIPVICGAEAVLPADRTVLSRAFGPVFETYGSRETMLIAAECEAHDGMHLSEENLFVETATGADTGDVLVTDLHNWGMPFIRYMNGDVAMLGKRGRCACGRGLRKIQRVEGRRADTLMDREGNPIPGIVFHVLFSDARREIVKQFQATQKPTGDVVLKVVRGPDYREEDFSKIVRRFNDYLRGLPLSVELVDGLPPAPNGKMRTIVVEK